MEKIFKRKRKKKFAVKITAIFIILFITTCGIYTYKTIAYNKCVTFDISDAFEFHIENVKRKTDVFSDSKVVMNMLKSGNYKCSDKKIAYLTFDDGPSCTVTPKILDTLKENKINGTFFVVGREIEKSKDILKRIVSEGNAIGVHTYSHDYNILYPEGKINEPAFMEEVEKTNDLVINELGEKYKTRVIRFPGGSYSWKGTSEIDKFLFEKGYSYIDWNCIIGDAEGKPKNKDGLLAVFNETKSNVAGDGNLVILMHDTYGKESTAEALPEIINKLKNEGYEFHILI